MTPGAAPPWRVVCFDLDGTLVRGTTVSQHLADCFGHGDLMADLERRYATQEISNAEGADQQGLQLAGRHLGEITEALKSIPRIAGIEETLRQLRSKGLDVLLCTVTWKFAAQWFQACYGFGDVCGTEMATDSEARLTGRVTRHFDKYDKRAFVEHYCATRGLPLSSCIAVGDSHADIPLFQVVGFSIALNATPEARAAATVSVDADTLTAILEVIPGFGSSHKV